MCAACAIEQPEKTMKRLAALATPDTFVLQGHAMLNPTRPREI